MTMALLPGSRYRPSPARGSGYRRDGNFSPVMRDKVSRVGVLSAALVLYSGITLVLIVWNGTTTTSTGDQNSGSTTSTIAPPAPVPPVLGAAAINETFYVPNAVEEPRVSGTVFEEKGGAVVVDVGATGDVKGQLEQPPVVGADSAVGDGAVGGAAVSGGDGDAGEDSRGAEASNGGEDRGFKAVLDGAATTSSGERETRNQQSEEGEDETFPRRDETNEQGDGSRSGNSEGEGEGEDGERNESAFVASGGMEKEFDVTLVSQTSSNRFWMLPFLCQRWGGPISIAILEEDREHLPENLCSHMLISSTWAQSPDELDPAWYPVNRLRNVAVAGVQTTHFLMTDIDIWPDAKAYEALHMRYRLETERMEDPHNAIVFTAFSRRRFCDEGTCLEYAKQVPQTIADLKPCLESNTCGRFDAANQSGQGTAYVYYWRSMLRQPDKRNLEHILCFKSHRFEPYLVVRKTPSLPKFDERFTGYGKNKIQWINHLRYMGFSFYVMPVNFVIHAPHPKSLAKTEWEKTGGKQGQGNKLMDLAFEEFMGELRADVGEGQLATHLCQSKEANSPKQKKSFGKSSKKHDT